jgi:ubiquitin-protein ligase E3 D
LKMDVEEEISVYGELLSHLRQVSVVVNLPTLTDSSTAAQLSQDSSTIRLHHRGQSKDLVLPAAVAAPQNLPVESRGVSSLSWRLPLAPSEPAASLDAPAIPWAASSIVPGSPLRCRGCKSVFVSQGTVKVWKDLPSENWAEMMEFWHCHKPANHDHHDGAKLTQRGYGANSTIAAQASIGFVDLTSLLFTEQDCLNLKVSPIAHKPIPLRRLSRGVKKVARLLLPWPGHRYKTPRVI